MPASTHTPVAIRTTATFASGPAGLGRYRGLWAWLIVPMVLMQAGIFVDYRGDFSENDWSIHVHYRTATA
jgi:hypothetical protein